MYFDAVLFAEAAQHAATYGYIRLAAGAQVLGHMSGQDADHYKVRSGLGKPYMIGCYGLADSADVQGFRFSANSFGKYYPRWKRYGVEGVNQALIDMRRFPMPLEEGDELTAEFYEDKSTNVEAAVLALIGYDKFGLESYLHDLNVRKYEKTFMVDVLMSSTTAAVVSGGDKTLGDGADGALLADRYYDVLGYTESIPSADGKACWLTHPEWPTSPGFLTPQTDLGQLNNDPMTMLPKPLPFKGSNPPQVWTYDITGTTTPTHSFLVGQYAKGVAPGR